MDAMIERQGFAKLLRPSIRPSSPRISRTRARINRSATAKGIKARGRTTRNHCSESATAFLRGSPSLYQAILRSQVTATVMLWFDLGWSAKEPHYRSNRRSPARTTWRGFSYPVETSCIRSSYGAPLHVDRARPFDGRPTDLPFRHRYSSRPW